MAEDQGYNGDKWNEYAVYLLTQFGWEKIGDTNMDLEGEEENVGGVDALMVYEQPGYLMKRTVVVESKRYQQSSLSKSKIYDWLSVLSKKLDMFRNSENLIEQFPILQDCENIKHGIILNWITDADKEFLSTYAGYLLDYSNQTNASLRGWKRIAIANNERINILRSILSVMKSRSCNFYYPSQLTGTNSGAYKKVLTLEYMFSNIILAEDGNSHEKIVFYFGQMNYESLEALSQCLNLYQYSIEGSNLSIYHYEDNDEVRKILPTVKSKLFANVNVTFIVLEKFAIDSEPKI